MKLLSLFKKFGAKAPKHTDNIYIFCPIHERLVEPTQICWDAVLGKGYFLMKDYPHPIPIYEKTIWCIKNAFDNSLRQELRAIVNKPVRIPNNRIGFDWRRI